MENDSYVLIMFRDNWADEIDLKGFRVTTRKDWLAYVDIIRNHFNKHNELVYYVGTNEENIYTSSEEVFKKFAVIDVTKEQADLLIHFFSGYHIGKVYYGFTGPEPE